MITSLVDTDVHLWCEENNLPFTDADPEVIFVDVETTGLNEVYGMDHILEIGLVSATMLGEVCDVYQNFVHGELLWSAAIESMSQFVVDMHETSGLTRDYRTCMRNAGVKHPDHITAEIINWLADQYISMDDPSTKLPLAGNTIRFDRLMLEQDLPGLTKSFHYRSIDVSSLKVMCKKLNPLVYDKMDAARLLPGGTVHRSLPDLGTCLREYRFYLDNFIWTCI